MKAATLLLLAPLVLASCADEQSRPPAQPLEPRDECYGRPDRVLCLRGEALTCATGKVSGRETCAAPLSCFDRVGCRVCEPNAVSCDGKRRSVCNAEGSAIVPAEECAADLSCSAAGCLDLCAEAAKNRSYLGCDYWPVFTANSLLDPLFLPAVAVGNGNLVSAHIKIEKAQIVIAEFDVPPGDSRTTELKFDAALKDAQGSRLVRQGAYHLTASVPVTVHQFNPLLFELPQSCTPRPGADASAPPPCYSHTNDASLLFPSTALTADPETSEGLRFLAASRPAFMQAPEGANDRRSFASTAGFVAVVAVGSGPARVTLRSTAFTQPSPVEGIDPLDALEALAPGGTLERILAPGDVLQVLTSTPSECQGVLSLDARFCDPGPQLDLTGTSISADAPIQVISGHDCTYVPYNQPACDHLEESLVPLHAWGSSAVVTVPSPAAGGQYVLRLLSGSDNNTVSFDPPVMAPITLAKEQVVDLSAGTSLLVKGTGRLMFAQYLIGQGSGLQSVGDPSLTFAVPIDQYRKSYNFLSPATYELNFVDIVALMSDAVTLDGELVSNFVKVGTSPYGVATVALLKPGAHEVRGSFGIGIQLYGLGSYTSYMLPGGLDLAPIYPIGI